MVEYKLGYRYEVVKWYTDKMKGKVCTYVGEWSDEWTVYDRFKLDAPVVDEDGDEFEYIHLQKPRLDDIVRIKEISYFGIEKNYTI